MACLQCISCYTKKTMVMKSILLTAVVVLASVFFLAAQSHYATNNGYIFIFSEAPLTNIDAVNAKVKVVVNTNTQEMTFDLHMTDFEFKNPKMGKDAGKKFLERDTYPDAHFKGKITGSVNYHKPGSYSVVVTGKLKIHGVERNVSEKGTIMIGKGEIKLQSEFNVLLKDYNIETPSILGQEMTSDHVQIKVDAMLAPQSHP
jgi:polyisoprenoid-binding protein YceI